MPVRIALRFERGCGFRVKGGSYVEGSGLTIPCPALPLAIPDCEVCGQTLIPFTRGMRQINPKKMVGEMIRILGRGEISCLHRTVCDRAACAPQMEKGWVMWVGSEYTMEQFRLEAERYGISKRVSKFPKELERGDVVYLVYNTAIERREGNKILYDPAIFYIFHVTDKVQIVDEQEAKDEAKVKAIEDRGVTPVLERDHVEQVGGTTTARKMEVS